MEKSWDVVVFIDPNEHEVLRFPLGDAPIPAIGDTIWFEGKLSGNGYQVIHRSIEFDRYQVTLVVKL